VRSPARRVPSPLARGCARLLRALLNLRRGLLRVILATAGCVAPVEEPPASLHGPLGSAPGLICGIDAFAAQVLPDYVRG
jgi:hypothetical protein